MFTAREKEYFTLIHHGSWLYGWQKVLSHSEKSFAQHVNTFIYDSSSKKGLKRLNVLCVNKMMPMQELERKMLHCSCGDLWCKLCTVQVYTWALCTSSSDRMAAAFSFSCIAVSSPDLSCSFSSVSLTRSRWSFLISSCRDEISLEAPCATTTTATTVNLRVRRKKKQNYFPPWRIFPMQPNIHFHFCLPLTINVPIPSTAATRQQAINRLTPWS